MSKFNGLDEYSSITNPVKPAIESTTIKSALISAGLSGAAAFVLAFTPAFPAVAAAVAGIMPGWLAPWAGALIPGLLAAASSWAAGQAVKNRIKVGDIQGVLTTPSNK